MAGHVPPAPGEHPRLFFRRDRLEELKARAKTPEGRAILTRLRKTLNGGDGQSLPAVRNPMTSAYGKQGGPKPRKTELPVGAYSISHAAGYGFLYQLTAERKYAALGRQCFERAFAGTRDRDREARYSWKRPGGALRAGPSLGWYAAGYDLCCDGWDEEFRKEVARAIMNYDEGKHCSLPELARGSRHMPASNHWGMQVGGAGLALLAIMNDPGVDMKKIEPLLEQNAKAMVLNMTKGFGDHGWFPEGDGTGSMSSQIAFIPALQAWRTAGGRDFISPRPNAPWMTLKWIFLTVPRDGKPDFPCRGAYPHNVWDRDGISGAGYFCEGFGGVREIHTPALLWFYNRHFAARDAENGTPFDTPSPYPHHAILSFVNWPFGTEERNPAACLPRTVGDTTYGFYMCRNRWKDADDIVVSVQTYSTRGWHRARSTGAVFVWGLGKKSKWGHLRNGLSYFRPAADGSASMRSGDGTCLAVDFSGACGAPAMLVMCGRGAPRDGRVTAGDVAFAFRFLTRGKPPEPAVAGDKIVIDKQAVRFADGHIVLETMAGPAGTAAGVPFPPAR